MQALRVVRASPLCLHGRPMTLKQLSLEQSGLGVPHLTLTSLDIARCHQYSDSIPDSSIFCLLRCIQS